MKENMRLAMVALAEEEMPPVEALIEAIVATLERTWPDLPPITAMSGTGNLITFAVGEATAALTLIPMPIPWSQLEGPCSTAWYWPEATESMRGHKAHVLVALVDEGRDQVAKSILLTQLVSAVAERTPCVGIFWGGGRLVHEPQAFIQESRQMTRKNLPLFLWIDFRIEEQVDGTLVCYTTGMEVFGHKELEVRNYGGGAQELLDSMYNIAHYLLDKGPVLKDGETIGLTDAERIHARHAESMWDPSREVIQLEF